jgi:hypothetical protein
LVVATLVHTYAYPHANANPYTQAYSDTNANTYASADTDTYDDTYLYNHTYTNTHGSAGCFRDLETHPCRTYPLAVADR